MPKNHRAAVDLAPLLDGSSAGELIPELARYGLQQLIELEAAAVIGADRHERTEERLGYRNGYRPRSLTTQVGDIGLLIPKLRAGSFLPSILEPRRRVDQALYAVIMEAYIGGVSTRKVDALVAALGSQSGISKSQVSRICQEIDQQVQAFLPGSPGELPPKAPTDPDVTLSRHPAPVIQLRHQHHASERKDPVSVEQYAPELADYGGHAAAIDYVSRAARRSGAH